MKKDTLHFGKRYSLTKGLYLYMSHNLYNYLAMLLGIKKVHNPIILAKTTLVKKFKDALPFH